MPAYNLFEPLSSLDLSNWHVEISETCSSQCFTMHDNYLKKEKIITLKDKGTTAQYGYTRQPCQSCIFICTLVLLKVCRVAFSATANNRSRGQRGKN